MTTNQYPDHIRKRHRIRWVQDRAQRLVPTVTDARRAAPPAVAAEPVSSMPLLPAVAPIAPALSVVWAIATLDGAAHRATDPLEDTKW